MKAEDIISEEELEKLSLEEAQKYLIGLVEQLPDDKIEDLYKELKRYLDEDHKPILTTP